MKIWTEKDPHLNRLVWRADFTLDNRRHRPKAATQKELLDIIASIRGEARAERYGLLRERPAVTLRQLVEERVKDLNLTLRNHRTTRRVVESFRDAVGPARLVESLSTADGVAFKRARATAFRLLHKREMSPHTINRELEYITTTLRMAGRYFPALDNWKPPQMPYERISAAGRERIITREEDAALLEKLREPKRRGESRLAHRTRADVADIFEIDINTGMRLGEIERLEKSFFHPVEEIVSIPAALTKTRKARDVPLNDAALAIIRRRSEESPHPRFLFTNLAGTRPISRTKIYRCLKREAKRAGVNYGRFSEGGFTPHDGRHTAATEMLHAGSDLATVGDVLGHSKKFMTLMYSHSTLASRKRAVSSIRRKAKAVVADEG